MRATALLPRRLTGFAVATLMFLTACGGGGDQDDRSGAAGACSGTALTVTETGTNATSVLTSSAAVSLSDGAAYTLYAADFDIVADTITFYSAPRVPAEGTLATLALTVFNSTQDLAPLTAGTEIVYTDEFDTLTFRAVLNTGSRVLGNGSGAAGVVQVEAVGERVCISVDYSDDEKTVVGTIEAVPRPA